MNISHKKCYKCNNTKSLSMFSKNVKTKDRLCKQCKECDKKYRLKNKEKRLKYNKEYYKTHKNQIKETQSLYYQANQKKIIKQQTQYNKEHKKEKCEYDKKYYIKNKTKIQKNKGIYEKNRCQTDLNYKLSRILRSRIRSAIKLQLGIKAHKSIKLLGCSIENVRKHLESKFTEEMSWDNYGYYGWHIDHIKPCSSFDLTDPEQQKKCFHYTNLQPLWAEDNFSKGSEWKN